MPLSAWLVNIRHSGLQRQYYNVWPTSKIVVIWNKVNWTVGKCLIWILFTVWGKPGLHCDLSLMQFAIITALQIYMNTFVCLLGYVTNNWGNKGDCLKAIGHFWTEQKLKVHRFTKKLTGFTEGNGEGLPLKYYYMKCFTFWENIRTIINSRYGE